MDLFYLFKILWRKKYYLLFIPAISAVASYFLTEDLPHEYLSSAQIATGFTDQSSIGYYNEDFNLRESSVKFINVIETMNSPMTLSLLSYRLLLHDLDNEEKAFRNLESIVSDEQDFLYLTDKETLARLEDLVQKKLVEFGQLNPYVEEEKQALDLLKLYGYDYKTLQKQLRIYRVGASDYIKVDFISESPFFSAYVVNTLSEEYIRFYNHSRSNVNLSNLAFFEKIKNEKKNLLDEKSKELNDLKRFNDIIDVTSENDARLAQIAEYESKRETYREEINGLDLKIRALNRKLDNANLTGNSRANERILELNKRISELSKMTGASDQVDAEVQATLKRLRQELQDEMRIANTNVDQVDLLKEKEDLELQRDIAASNLNSVENSLGRLRSIASGIANKSSLVASLQKEVDKLTEEYLAALKDYNQERSKTFIASAPLQLVIPGQPSDSPLSSKRIIIVGLATIATFLFTLFVVILVEYVDARLKNPAGFKRQTDLKLAGAVNQVAPNKLNLNILFGQVKDKEQEFFRESLRKLRFEITNKKDQPKKILVTSTKKGEGKSFLILCLAYSLSLMKYKVLIIDTNFKNASLTKFLLKEPNYDVQPRLLADGSGSSFELPASIISKTTHDNIDVVGSKQVAESPSEIFSDRNFNEFMEGISRGYDYIFLEGAALNDFSDTKELVNYVDMVVPVFSADSALKQKDRESIDYLKQLNGKLAGAILNKTKLKDLEL